MFALDKVVTVVEVSAMVEVSVVVNMGEVAEVGVVLDELRSCLYSAEHRRQWTDKTYRLGYRGLVSSTAQVCREISMNNAHITYVRRSVSLSILSR